MAVAAWPPGRSTNSAICCLLSGSGYCPTIAIRSMVLRPKPTTSNPRDTIGPGAIGNSIIESYQTRATRLDFRLLFAYYPVVRRLEWEQAGH